MSTLVIVPAYKEELTIGYVVSLSKKYGDVVVVDDGSPDRTEEIARESGAKVIKHEMNMGKSEALKTGFKYALENKYDLVVCIDADGQHDPDEIPVLLDPIVEDKADAVIGSRYIGGNNIPRYRRFGLWILNEATSFVSNVDVDDSQSGFRALSRKALENLSLRCGGYSIESDMIVQLAEKGLEIAEAPVNISYDVPNRHKKNAFFHGFSILNHLVSAIGYKRPLLSFGLLSLICFLVALVLGYMAFESYPTTGRIYLTQAVAAGIFTVIGSQFFIAGLVLNAIARELR